MNTRTLLILLVLLLPACAQTDGDDLPVLEGPPEFVREGTLAFVRGADTLATIAIEIADTDSARTRGLMERTSLPEMSGMLFVFERAEPQSFWMSNTPLSLDILFVGADSQIVRVAKYTTPYSTEMIRSEAPAQFVVEVPAGFADRYGIVVGGQIIWERE